MKLNVKIRGAALLAVSAATATALLVAGCSSSGGGSAAGAAAASQHTASQHTASQPAVAKQRVRVEVQNGPQGAHLADGSGKGLYMFASDTASSSTCNSACATYWPPLIATGHPQAVGAVKAAALAAVTRSDGRKQVTYAGHPLYYYVGDTKAGDVNGQGLDDFGAYWWLLTPAGKVITGSGSDGSGSMSTGGGGW